jgi:hypothetical protein
VVPLTEIPSLDALAENPTRALDLAPEVLTALIQRAATVITTLAQRQAAQAGAQHPTPSVDRTLGADEIAAALGRDRRWVFRNAKRLPFIRRISRKCVVGSKAELIRWRDGQKA